MNIAEAKEQVKDTVEAYLAKDSAGFFRIAPSRQRPIFLIGAPGIGKTAIMSQIADELGIGLVSYSMTHHTRQSALGLPFIVHHEYQGHEFDVSEYTMSEIISSVYDYMETTGVSKGILFLDEINCVSETLYPSMLQFLQFKTFGRHRVPDNWIIVCAGNPPEYNRSVHEFDIVTLDRLRKIEVEPDLETWKDYARDTNVHPAILAFLEVRGDCFYSVETTPEGKCFVTARGWSDLSEIMTLFEDMGKPIDLSLISQYLQDPEIAERFSLYYDLFRKYRSDYQIPDILAGQTPEGIVQRAQEAQFDERLALLGMLIDGVASKCEEALVNAEMLMLVRDMLREAKPEILDGDAVAEAVGTRIEELERRLNRKVAANAAATRSGRATALAIALGKELVARCGLERTPEGPDGFATIQAAFGEAVSKLNPVVDTASSSLDNAFAFIDDTFGADREALVFVTEVTARSTTASFINRFGSESYYAHSDELMVDRNRDELKKELESIDLSSQN